MTEATLTFPAVTPQEKTYRKYNRKESRKRASQKHAEKRIAEMGREEWNRQAAERMKKSRLTAKVRAYMFLGGQCETCSINDMRVLELDHVNNDGKKHRRIGKHALCREVLKNPSIFQLLCANCHTLKHWNERS